jgi:uncharacterized protein YbaR (Trm112 family)
MFIELLDLLRCPNDHEESSLVLAARQTEGRDVTEGVLGCPVCQAEYPITAGVARFDVGAPATTPSVPPDENAAVRLAATLDLTGHRGYAILVGTWGNHAPLVRDLTDVPLMLVNPPADVEMGAGLSGLTIGSHWTSLPLATARARAVALDDTIMPTQLASVLATVSPGGRILAPVSLPLPNGVTELARDGEHWIAERAQTPIASGIISLGRRG